MKSNFVRTSTDRRELGSAGVHSVADDMTGDTLLRYAAAAERDSEHPLAKAIVNHALAQGLDLPLL